MTTEDPQRRQHAAAKCTAAGLCPRSRPAVTRAVAIASLLLAGCATTVESSGRSETPAPSDQAIVPATTAQSPRTTVEAVDVTGVPAVTTTTVPTTTAAPTTTAVPAITAVSTTSTTTTALPDPTTSPPDTIAPDLVASAANAICARVATASALDDIAEETGNSVSALWVENGFRDDIAVGALIDVCTDNGIDDIEGGVNPRHDDPVVSASVAANVERQQGKLNELFAPLGTQPLVVDGISGPRTGQRLCAARVALGLEPTVDDMEPGSADQVALFAATELPAPTSVSSDAERWVLIDRTCQMMFAGSGPEMLFAFPTSTGTEGFETRLQNRARVFRFNPAVDNGGWHDSSEYPVGVDNPLNGNLYKPLYFDLGQAIHGATNVPAAPASKGCARLSVANQETLLDWLGLLSATEETWRKNEIDLTVDVQGEFQGR